MLFKEKENLLSLYNAELMEACRLLKEYAQYVEQVRKFAKKAFFGSSRAGSRLLHQEWDTGRFPVKESGGGDSGEYRASGSSYIGRIIYNGVSS